MKDITQLQIIHQDIGCSPLATKESFYKEQEHNITKNSTPFLQINKYVLDSRKLESHVFPSSFPLTNSLILRYGKRFINHEKQRKIFHRKNCTFDAENRALNPKNTSQLDKIVDVPIEEVKMLNNNSSNVIKFKLCKNHKIKLPIVLTKAQPRFFSYTPSSPNELEIKKPKCESVIEMPSPYNIRQCNANEKATIHSSINNSDQIMKELEIKRIKVNDLSIFHDDNKCAKIRKRKPYLQSFDNYQNILKGHSSILMEKKVKLRSIINEYKSILQHKIRSKASFNCNEVKPKSSILVNKLSYLKRYRVRKQSNFQFPLD